MNFNFLHIKMKLKFTPEAIKYIVATLDGKLKRSATIYFIKLGADGLVGALFLFIDVLLFAQGAWFGSMLGWIESCL